VNKLCEKGEQTGCIWKPRNRARKATIQWIQWLCNILFTEMLSFDRFWRQLDVYVAAYDYPVHLNSW